MKKHYINFLITLMSIFIALVSPVFGQTWGDTDDQIEPLSHSLLNGVMTAAPYSHAIIQGDMLFYTDYNGFNAYSVSDPTNPVKIGYVGIPGKSTNFTIYDNYAYVCMGTGIAIVNISDPSDLQLVNVEFLAYKPYQIIVEETGAFIAESNGVHSYSMPDAEHLLLQSFYSIPAGTMNFAGFVKSGNYIFFVNQSDLFVLNVTNPLNMMQVYTTALNSGGVCWGNILIKDQYLYVLSNLQMNIYDVSNPMLPISVYADNPVSHSMYDMVIEDDRMIISHNSSQLWDILDISVPASPVVLHSSNTPMFHGLYSLGILKSDNLYVLDNEQQGYDGYKIHIIDISNVTLPLEIASVNSIPGKTKSISLMKQGGSHYALVAQDNNFDTQAASGFLRILNVDDPENPTLVSTIELPQGVVSVASAGLNYAFVGLAEYTFPYYYESVALIGLSDVTNPSIQGVSPLGINLSKQNHSNLSFVNGHLYAIYEGAINVLAESSGTLVQLGSVPVLGAMGRAVFAEDENNLYVAAGTSGLYHYELSNPVAPNLVTLHDTPGNAYDVFVDNDIAYVADFSAGLAVFDISQPLIQLLSQAACPANSVSVVVFDQVAYVGLEDGRIQMFDVSVPANPAPMGWYLTDGTLVNDMVVDTNNLLLYVANELQVMIAQLPDESTDVPDYTVNKTGVSVYPNPAGQSTRIGFNLTETATINLEVYDVCGKVVERLPQMTYPCGSHLYQLNTASFPAGIYYVRIVGTAESMTQKFIVQH